MECTLCGTCAVSSEWHVAQVGIFMFFGCGYSFTPSWQVVHPRSPWTLDLCLAGSTCRLLPDSDFIPGSPWQARQSWSPARAGKAQSRVKAIVRPRRNPSFLAAVMVTTPLAIRKNHGVNN